MRCDIVTIFPALVDGALAHGVIGRARERSALDVRVHDLRDFADPPRRGVDDEPYGGGAGMLFRVEPLLRAVEALRRPRARTAVLMPSAAGDAFNQSMVFELAEYEQLLFLCDRYEGSDERVKTVVTHELSLGEFVISGGELAAAVMVDAVARLIPGVVGSKESVTNDSFSRGLLDSASYTRPPSYRGLGVPPVLAMGNHAEIVAWRRHDALRRTWERRPELLRDMAMSSEENVMMARERPMRSC